MVGLFNHRRTVLGDPIELRHASVDFTDPCRLLLVGMRNIGVQIRDLIKAPGQFLQTLLRRLDHFSPFSNLLRALRNQFCDFLRRIRGMRRQGVHFAGHDGKSAPSIADPRRLDTSIQRQKIGLEGNVANQPRDMGNLYPITL